MTMPRWSFYPLNGYWWCRSGGMRRGRSRDDDMQTSQPFASGGTWRLWVWDFRELPASPMSGRFR